MNWKTALFSFRWLTRIFDPGITVNDLNDSNSVEMEMDASGPDKIPPFEVFFDGQCPLCRREIDMIRRMDRRGQLILTDIASDSFEPESVPLDQLMREIHGRVVGGPYVTGVEVFRQIYQRVGWGAVVGPTRWPHRAGPCRQRPWQLDCQAPGHPTLSAALRLRPRRGRPASSQPHSRGTA